MDMKNIPIIAGCVKDDAAFTIVIKEMSVPADDLYRLLIGDKSAMVYETVNKALGVTADDKAYIGICCTDPCLQPDDGDSDGTSGEEVLIRQLMAHRDALRSARKAEEERRVVHGSGVKLSSIERILLGILFG